MDLPSSNYAQSIAAIVALLIACFLGSLNVVYKTRKGKTNLNNKVPEISGALPFIGHLHLINSQVPYFRTFTVLAEKYGPIFSLNLGCNKIIVVNNGEIAKECLTANDRVFASKPDTIAGKYIGYDNAILGLSSYGQYWREIRKIAVLELLSSHRLEKLKHVRDKETYSLVKDLLSYGKKKKESGGSIQVPISNFLEHMTFNIIVEMIAGKQFGVEAIDNEGSEGWRLHKAIKDATYLFGVFVVADAIPCLSSFDFQGHVSFMKKTAKEIDLILNNWMDEHLRKRDGNGKCDEKDLMDVMISTFGGHDMIYGHKREIVIKATSMMLILTGSESIAITLTWALSLLINHPSVLKAAQEELDTKIGKQNWVHESDINELKYLQAIVKETLRLYPPAPLTGIRKSTEDCCVAGYHVEKGTRLLINLWKIHRDPEVWSNPDEFKPERFFNTQKEVDFCGMNFNFIPFSYGRRSCPGMTYGMQMVHLTLARLLQGFDIWTKDRVPVDMSEGLGLALPKKKVLQVVLEPRLPLELYEHH